MKTVEQVVLSGQTIPKEIVEWLLGDDHGSSSENIVRVAYGLPARYHYPLDEGDFGRCLRLLQRFPHLDVNVMRGVNAVWRGLAENWAPLTELYSKYHAGESDRWKKRLEHQDWRHAEYPKQADEFYVTLCRQDRLKFDELISTIRAAGDEKLLSVQNNFIVLGDNP